MFARAAAVLGTTWRAAWGTPWPGPRLPLLVLNLSVLPLALRGIHALDTDMFYHLAGGRYMAQQGRILDREIFSFTIPGQPWTNYSWLFEYGLFRLHELGGFTALIALRAVVVLLTANLLFGWCRRRAGGDGLAALAMALLAVGLYGVRAANIRPHLVDYLFLVATMWLLDRLWRRPRRLEPWLPLLCVAWANLHGVAYPLPLLAIAAHAAAALLPRAREPVAGLVRDPDVLRWPALFLASAAAFAVNPFGLRVFATALMALDTGVLRHIQEMQPLPWRTLFNLAPDTSLSANSLGAYVLVVCAVAVPWWLRRRDLRALLLLAGAGVLAAGRWRFLLEFGILVLPFAGEAWSGARAAGGPRPRWSTAALSAITAVLLVGIAVNAHGAFRDGEFARLSPTAYPIGAARFLAEQGLEGNAFSAANVSGYLEWALFPRVRVFMDMRTPEPFDGETFWLYREVAFAADPAPLRRLEARWPIDMVLLYREAPLGRALAADPSAGFRLAYADDRFVLFVHQRLLGRRPVPLLAVLDPFDASAAYVAALAPPALAALRAEAARLVRVWPANHLAHQAALAAMVAAGEAGPAAERAAGLVAAFPREARYRYAAGMALRALGRPAEALAAFERALALDRSLGVAAVAAAETALQLGRYDTGRALMEEELARKRDRLTAAEYRLLGDLRYRTGDPAAAVQAYERALWLAPEDALRADVENNLGSAYLDLGRADRALEHLQAALGRVPNFPEAEFNRARAWARIGQQAEARQVFQRLAEDSRVPTEVRTRARARLAPGGLAADPAR